ncbi:MAG: SIMPL domain-containing protein [Burkholderiaceae bacterium]|nr:SIMPL domain-containing protein [Burkholderiaceae bacterium]MCD8536821.1 SIMPL domain-containing protein [Burkholderiaceae bacterium]MCD8565506.1 SIMPL domain-containing protein [Burkholderiaceae bacterium]
MCAQLGFEKWFLKLSLVVASVACLSLSPMVHASDDSHRDGKGAVATIEVSASKEVLQDQVQVVFSAQASGGTAAEVNRNLSDALSQARANFTMPDGIEVSTGGFNVYLDYGKDNKPRGWTGRASLVVNGKKLESVSAVIEHLGKSLAVSSVQFSLSRDARRDQEKALMQDLAHELGQRAGLAAQAFGFKSFEIMALDFTGGMDFSSRPTMQRMAATPMMADTGPAVTLEPSMTTVEISVTGQIRLH